MKHIITERYHIYNRGAHKAPIFLDRSDYERFIALLLVCNDTSVLSKNWHTKDIFLEVHDSKDKIVSIFAYCLMPNHFHIGVEEKTDGGITRFIRKLCTSYSMYYNRKYDHSGTILQGQYKEKHVDSDEYLRYLIQYIHLNPYGIEEPDMDRYAKMEDTNFKKAIDYSKDYEYSSFKEYLGEKRKWNCVVEPIKL